MSKKMLIVSSIVLFAAALAFKAMSSPDSLTREEIVKFSDAGKLSEGGLTEKAKNKLKSSPAINKLRKKVTTEDDRKILEGGILMTARSVQILLNDPYNVAEVDEQFNEYLFFLDCFSDLWKTEGIDAVIAARKAVQDTPEKDALAMIASKPYAFKISERTHRTREECLRKVESR